MLVVTVLDVRALEVGVSVVTAVDDWVVVDVIKLDDSVLVVTVLDVTVLVGCKGAGKKMSKRPPGALSVHVVFTYSVYPHTPFCFKIIFFLRKWN